MFKTAVALIFLIVFTCNPVAASIRPEQAVNQALQPAAPPFMEAGGAILVDQDSGEVVYAKNAGFRLYPASTTKILTALLAIEHGPVDEMITVGREIERVPANGSRAGLQVGDRISLGDLIYALMLPSGNDAAYALAAHIGRAGQDLPLKQALEVYRDTMNQRAAALGARDSHFVNPDGYHHPDHYSTPYDMALISREAMKNPLFRTVVATPDYALKDYKPVSKKALELENTNSLIHPDSRYYMPIATGIKTGHTSPAGYCLVSSASYNQRNLISVVLYSSENGVLDDSRRFLDFGFTVLRSPVQPETVDYPSRLAGYPLYWSILTVMGVYIGFRLWLAWWRRRKRPYH